jgi:Fuc2NAc and GlcNAc transferase
VIVAAGLAALLSFLFVGLFLRLARRTRLLDRPGHRSSHTEATPTGAGTALIFALGATVLVVGLEPATPRIGVQSFPAVFGVLMGGAFGLSMLGLLDDARGVPAAWRLLAQLLAALGLVLVLQVSSPWQFVLFLLGLTWTMNAFNFMDGSDGMAGMQAVFSGVLLAGLFYLAGDRGLALAALSLAAAALGFLPWNWPPARVFMGDAGSVPLGWLLGGLCLVGGVQGSLSWPAVLLVLAVFHVDAGLTLLRRVWAGERWYTAHRTHVYQKLLVRGWDHGRVLWAYAALNLLIVTPALMFVSLEPRWDRAVALITLMILVITWCAVSLKLGERP